MRLGMHCRIAYKYIAENFIMVIVPWRMTELRRVLHKNVVQSLLHIQ